jgi:DHA2 family multidrug resistance protein
MVLLASSALLAPFLENLGNYPVADAGLIMAPRGAGTMAAMLIAGRLTNKVDPRLLMLFGYALLAASLYMQMGWTQDESVSYRATTIIVQGAGLGFVFIPLQIVAFYTMAPELRTQGASMLSLVRNIGSAIGISLTSALLDRMSQYEHANLAGLITPFDRVFSGATNVSRMLDPTTAGGAGLLNSMIDTQSQVIAYIDDYKFLLITVIPSVACLLLMSVPKKRVAAAAPVEAHAAMD